MASRPQGGAAFRSSGHPQDISFSGGRTRTPKTAKTTRTWLVSGAKLFRSPANLPCEAPPKGPPLLARTKRRPCAVMGSLMIVAIAHPGGLGGPDGSGHCVSWRSWRSWRSWPRRLLREVARRLPGHRPGVKMAEAWFSAYLSFCFTADQGSGSVRLSRRWDRRNSASRYGFHRR